jgi:catechol 2,3-dioxygenase-like lactoylglutathione lyase family enzyme
VATWFAHEYCTEIGATSDFYGRLLGLTQIWDEPNNVAFRHDCVQLSFQRADSLVRPSGWAFQPGWGHGQLSEVTATENVRSISIALSPGSFSEAVARLQTAKVPRLRPEPFWVGYWSFVVQDPDGRTVEISDPVSAEDLPVGSTSAR